MTERQLNGVIVQPCSSWAKLVFALCMTYFVGFFGVCMVSTDEDLPPATDLWEDNTNKLVSECDGDKSTCGHSTFVDNSSVGAAGSTSPAKGASTLKQRKTKKSIVEDRVTPGSSSEGENQPQKTQTEQLWVIHGRRYDLRAFAATHPGGIAAINMARGRDCTELFESYHALTTRPHAMLNKFLAADQTNVPQPLFDWSSTPLYDELRKRVRAYFAEHGSHKESWAGWARHLGWTLLTVVCGRAWIMGEWWSLVVMPWAYWLGCSHMMHTGSHGGLSHVPWVNYMCTYLGSAHVSVHDWIHQHVIGHHAHTNLHGRDPDLEHFTHPDNDGPGFRLSEYTPYLAKYMGWVYAMPMQAFFATMGPGLVNQPIYWRAQSFFNVHFFNVSRLRVIVHVLGRVALVAFMVGVPLATQPTYLKALAFSILPLGFHGYIYYSFSQVSHATGSASKWGNEKECVTREWALHQLLHSLDYDTQSTVWMILSCGLNCQTFHHLFPAVAVSHFPALTRIVAEVAAEQGVPYTAKPSFWEAWMAHYRHIALLNEHPNALPAEVAKNTRSLFQRHIIAAVLYLPMAITLTPALFCNAMIALFRTLARFRATAHPHAARISTEER